MAILTYPLNGVLYDAEDVETYLCTRTSGVFSDEGHFTASITGSREITIGPGLAWMQNEQFHGKAIYNPENEPLEIAEADAYQTRIDRIVLQFDKLMNQTTLTVKQGTPASSPVPPEIERDSYIYELGLYTVNVRASSITISTSDISCTFLDESVCGIMEDAVTSIPTQELYDQWYAFFEQAVADTEAFESQFNAWFADIQVQAEEYMRENEQEFEAWRDEQKKDFDDWFENLEYVLDGDVAGKLEVEIENAQDTADTAMEQLATGWVEGFLTDEYGGSDNVLLADDSQEDYGISLSRPICNCDEGSTVDKFYPVGSIYMSVNKTDPSNLFGGVWQQIEDCFLLAAGSHDAGETGGAETVTLTSSQMPSHTHSTPSHTHSIPSLSGTAASAGTHTHTLPYDANAGASGTALPVVNTASGSSVTSGGITSAGAHTHSVTTNSSTTGSSSGTSGSTGSGSAHNNMPPYLTVYMWQRIA